MMRIVLAFVFSILTINFVFANSDTTLFYMKQPPGILASLDAEFAIPATSKGDATFIRAIISSAGDSLYNVSDYYLNGRIKFTGQSKLPSYDVKLEGAGVEFFPNGHKRVVCMFKNGNKIGDILTYFPNGRLNTIKTIPDVDLSKYKSLQLTIKTEGQMDSYSKMVDSLKAIILTQCQDSTGNILAENGKGKWVEYQKEYKTAFAAGEIINGHENGEWGGKLNDTLKYTSTYINGKLISGKSYSNSGKIYPFTKIWKLPEFDGGVYKFSIFLSKMIRYPSDAREKKVQGRVILRFIVNREGDLSDIAITRKVFPSMDAEAYNALMQSPKWIAGCFYGVKTDVVYSVPVSFTLAKDQ